MKSILSILLIVLLATCSELHAEKTDQFNELYKSYQAKYNFFSIKDSLYTIQSELELPEGYAYIELKDSSSFTFWVAHFPIWHKYKSVGLFRGGKFLEHDEVSRVIHLPWRGPSFKDVGIPLRIIGEYLLQRDNRFSFSVMPKKGEAITYKKWLAGKPAYNQKSELVFKEDIEKENSEDEYYKCILFSMQNVDYKSIARSCDTIAVDDLQPGDLYIASDTKGRKGKLYIIFHMITDSSGNKKYLVATGCPDACDLHIPKFNDNQNMPWIDLTKFQGLTKEFEQSNFYRLKTTVNDNIE